VRARIDDLQWSRGNPGTRKGDSNEKHIQDFGGSVVVRVRTVWFFECVCAEQQEEYEHCCTGEAGSGCETGPGG
jgi:hypothetical protein